MVMHAEAPPHRIASALLGRTAVASTFAQASPEEGLRHIRAYLEKWERFSETAEARESGMQQYANALREVKIARSILRFFREMAALGEWRTSAEVLSAAEDLYERADELVDTLCWAAEAPEDLASVVQEELCASK